MRLWWARQLCARGLEKAEARRSGVHMFQSMVRAVVTSPTLMVFLAPVPLFSDVDAPTAAYRKRRSAYRRGGFQIE